MPLADTDKVEFIIKKPFMKKSLLLFLMVLVTTSLWSQVLITGVVKDEAGEPIPGVSVILKSDQSDKPFGTITDTGGKYSLTLSSKQGVLIFSFIGMETIERSFSGNAVINVNMLNSSVGLNEVVAVGYGSQRKASVVGAISTISTKDLKQSSSANLINGLAGRLSGLTTVQRSGQPGADDPKIYIRGRGTWVDSDPLFIVDGVERESISNIDPNEIETVSILKDASATAVYGVKGANGVILVTTRRGTNAKPVVSFSALTGVQVPTRIPQHLRSYNTASLKNEAILNDFASQIYNTDGTLKVTQEEATSIIKQNGGFSPNDLAAFKSGTADKYYYPDVDWWGELIRPATPQQQYNLNVTGGTESAKYFVSVGYLTQEGIFKTESNTTNFNFNRFNLRSNLDLEVTSDLTFSMNLAARIEDRNLPNGSTWNPSGDPFYAINKAAPYETAIINPDGRPGYGINKLNAWAGLNKTGYQNTQTDVLEAAFVFKYDLGKLVKGLSAKGQIAYDSYYNDQKKYGQEVMWSSIVSEPGDPYAYEYNGKDEPFNYLGGGTWVDDKLYYDASLFYEKSISDHNVTALVLFNQTNERRSGTFIPYRYSGLVGRLTYNFDNRYMSEFNMGYNGSENFSPDKRFGFFPSVSLGWLMSEESFIKDNLTGITALKIRGSYGKVGNDKIGGNRFMYVQSFYSKTAWKPEAGAKFGYDANNREFIYESAAANPNVTWETATKSNLAVELNIKNSLLTFTGDLFFENREDILMAPQTIPSYFGVAPPAANIGKTENKGFDLEFAHRLKLSENFEYWVKGNFGFAKNKIIDKDEPPAKLEWQKEEGQSIGQYQGYISEGFFNDWDEIANSPEQVGEAPHPGDLKYKDLNSDGIIDYKDQTYIGYTDVPNINYGFSVGFNTHGFDFSVLLQGTEQSSYYIGDGLMFEFTNKNGKLLDHHLDRWAYYTDPYTGQLVDTRATAKYPRLTTDGSNPNQKVSTFFLLDNSYLKLRNIEVGYTFDKTWLKKVNISSLRLYATGQNLHTWTKVEQIDPEGGGNENYPQMSIYSVGLNVTF
jgi:TonB-linked SusC/RagA family outer membrane protein